MLKHLTITFQNEDTIVIPAKAIQHLNIENITKNIAVIDQDAMLYQKAEFVELSIYEDAIVNLKTAYMQDKPNVYKKTTISERLTYPTIESLQLDDDKPITVQWKPVKTHNDTSKISTKFPKKVKISTTGHYSSSNRKTKSRTTYF